MSTTRRALILVDVQPTFCEGGELAVTGGNQVAADLAAFVTAHRGDYDVVVTTQDWHIEPGDHFSPTPDFVDSWPAHGVAGTDNAAVHPVLAAALEATGGADVVILKGQYAAAYSGFDGTTQEGATLLSEMHRRSVTDIDVAGIAESHCVKATVLDALAAGAHTRLLTDLTVPVTPELGAAARKQMLAAGAVATSSANAF